MKKIYNLLAMVMFFIVAVGAQAAVPERAWMTYEDPVTFDAVQEGVPYLLTKGNAGEIYQDPYTNWLSHTGSLAVTYANESQYAWTLEKADWQFTANEDPYDVFYMYYTDAEGKKQYKAQTGYSFVEGVESRRAAFIIMEAVYGEDPEEGEEPELKYYTKYADVDGYQVLFVEVSNEEKTKEEDYTPRYFRFQNNNGSIGTATTDNVWYILTGAPMEDIDYADVVIKQLFGEGGFDRENYQTGKDPGQYGEAELDALEEAVSPIMDGDASDANVAALYEAYDKFKASFVEFGEGYYVLNTFRSPKGVLFDNTGNVAGATKNMYTTTDPAAAITHTSNGTEFSIGAFDVYDPDDLDEDENERWMSNDAARYFVWHVTKANIVEGKQMYYFQNYQTGQYLGGAPKNADGSLKPSNAPILMTAAPEASYNMEPATHFVDGKQYWTLYSDELTKKGAWGNTTWRMGGLHAPGDVMNLVTWDSSADGSCWYPRTITEEDLKVISGGDPEKAARMAELKGLITAAETAIANSKAYATFDAEGNYAVLHQIDEMEVDGLVTEEDQISSNATHVGDGDGIPGLVDNDFGTYWHSAWNEANAPEKIEVEDPEEGIKEIYPRVNMTFDLRQEVNEVTIKWFGRQTDGYNRYAGLPRTVRVLASNDFEADYDEWDLIEEEFEVMYEPKDDAHRVQVGTGEEAEVHNLYVGVIPVKLNKNYSCVRVELVKNHANGNPVYQESESFNTSLFCNASEVRVYEGILYEYRYDPENSKIEGVPAEVRTALETALATAKEEIENDEANQATIDALSSALENFNNSLPDPDAVRQALEEARAFQNAVEQEELIGNEIGDFQNGADNDLRAALDKINVTSTSNVQECQDALAAIKKALADFNSKLITPADGKYYRIKSATSGGQQYIDGKEDPTEADYAYAETHYADNDYVGMRNFKANQLSWGAEGNEDIDNMYGYVWQAKKNANGTFSLRHALTGRYLGCERKNNAAVVLVDSAFEFTYQSAKKKGILNLVLSDHVYLNAQPSAVEHNMVTWGAAEGYDNSAFTFEEVDGSIPNEVVTDIYAEEGAYRIATLPYTAGVVTPVFNIVGISKDGDKTYLELGRQTSGTIEAGTPFIYSAAQEEIAFTNVVPGYTTEVVPPVNGLQGVLLTNATIEKDKFFVFSTKNKVTTLVMATAQTIPSGSGFIGSGMPEVAYKAGNVQILCPDGAPETSSEGIESVLGGKTIANGMTFDLQGRRVQKAAKGLYIENGQKVAF